MFKIKGFIQNDLLRNNTPGNVAQFGELSTQALTFAREKGYFRDVAIANLELVTFTSRDDTNTTIQAPTAGVAHLLAVGKYLYDRFDAANILNDIPALITDLVSEFTAGGTVVSAFVINELIVSTSNGAKRLPDFLQWTMTVGGETYELTLWFNDLYFKSQYDEYEILIVEPILDIDGFYDTSANVGAAITAATPSVILTKAGVVAAGEPYTDFKAINYEWREHEDFGTDTRSVSWYVIIYGANGNNPDAIRTAIRDYLSDAGNTALTTDQWQEMFPTIFESSEYFLVPSWNKVITTIPSVLYSPLVRPATVIETSKDNVPFTTTDVWWEDNSTVAISIYQSLHFLVVGAPTNTASNDFDFMLKYPDYMNVATTDPDFALMSPGTQGFVEFLVGLLQAAESITPSSPPNLIPAGYSRVNRGGKMYLAGTYLGTQYLSISKYSFLP